MMMSVQVLLEAFTMKYKTLCFIFSNNLSMKVFFLKNQEQPKLDLFSKKRSTNRFNKLQTYFCLSMFLKVLENLMNNKLCNSLTANNILTSKQFGYQAGHSTAIVQLLDEITNGFVENKYTFGVSIDLSKVLDTVNHSILLEKLLLYVV